MPQQGGTRPETISRADLAPALFGYCALVHSFAKKVGERVGHTGSVGNAEQQFEGRSCDLRLVLFWYRGVHTWYDIKAGLKPEFVLCGRIDDIDEFGFFGSCVEPEGFVLDGETVEDDAVEAMVAVSADASETIRRQAANELRGNVRHYSFEVRRRLADGSS